MTPTTFTPHAAKVSEAMETLGYTEADYQRATNRVCGHLSRMPDLLEFRRRMGGYLRNVYGMSYPEIRDALGLATHTTALYLCRREHYA